MISVENRVPNPGQEGRVLITPENGSPFYATLAMADGATQAGTPWNRNTGNLLQADIRNYPIASGQTVTAGQVVDLTGIVATVSVGQTVNLLRNGELVPHIIAHIGNPSTSIYDDSCNGVWVLRQDITVLGAWDASGANTLPGSTILNTMQNSVQEYDPSVQNAIKAVKIPYCVGNSSATVNALSNGLSCKIFPLSGYEVGWTTATNSGFPVDGAVLSYFSGTSTTDAKRISNFNSSPTPYYTRSSLTTSSTTVWQVYENGNYGTTLTNGTSVGYREAFVLPIGTMFNEDGTVTVQQEITASGTPSQAIALQGGSAGDTIPVIFSGVARLAGVTQGQEITSPGVQGFGAMDGWLSVFPYWWPGIQVATGSYEGTGSYGQQNPVVIPTQSFPVVLLVCRKDGSDTLGTSQNSAFWFYGNSVLMSSGAGLPISNTTGGLSFYSTTSAANQLNASSVTYQWICITVSTGGQP